MYLNTHTHTHTTHPNRRIMRLGEKKKTQNLLATVDWTHRPADEKASSATL